MRKHRQVTAGKVLSVRWQKHNGKRTEKEEKAGVLTFRRQPLPPKTLQQRKSPARRFQKKRRRHRRPPDGIRGGNVLEYPEKTNDQRLLLWERNRPASVSTVPTVERSVSGSLSTTTDTTTVITGTR